MVVGRTVYLICKILMMKKVFGTAILLVVLSLISVDVVAKNKGAKKVPGVWQEQPIIIDGSSGDWKIPYPYYDEDAMLGYSVTNDSENLYITVQTGDAATQLKILEGGLTVWVDKTGKQDEVTAINFPIPANYKNRQHAKDGSYSREQNEPDPGPQEAVQKRIIEMQQNVKKAIAAADEYSLQGFKGCNFQFPVKAENSCGIVVRIDMDQDNELIWEAKIPFKAFYFKSKIERTDKNRTIAICFETTGSKRPDGQATRTVRGRGRSGGFRPSIGIGGMGMGMQFGGSGNQSTVYDPNANLMESLYKSTKTWVVTGVAVK